MASIGSQLRDTAEEYATRMLDGALKGLFGLIESELARRRTAAYAHKKALFHERIALLFGKFPGKLVGRKWRIARHLRMAIYWSAEAWARDKSLASACGICTPSQLTAQLHETERMAA